MRRYIIISVIASALLSSASSGASYLGEAETPVEFSADGYCAAHVAWYLTRMSGQTPDIRLIVDRMGIEPASGVDLMSFTSYLKEEGFRIDTVRISSVTGDERWLIPYLPGRSSDSLGHVVLVVAQEPGWVLLDGSRVTELTQDEFTGWLESKGWEGLVIRPATAMDSATVLTAVAFTVILSCGYVTCRVSSWWRHRKSRVSLNKVGST